MNSEPRGQRFPVSEKIYGALLRAYPAQHRSDYGDAMAQLFRDQCRDAWGESKNFGLLKLWLRVLPDLARTSILERLAALNERKTMSDKLGTLAAFGPSPGKIFTSVFVTVFLMVVIISVAVTYILPESFMSTAVVKVEPDGKNSPGRATSYDPYFLQTTFEIIQSEIILKPVVEKLNLNHVWGAKYFNNEELKTRESLQILKGRLALRPIRNTMLVSISVFSDDRREAAQIANAIAESYVEYRGTIQAESRIEGLASLKKLFEMETKDIQATQGLLAVLQKKLGIPEHPETPGMAAAELTENGLKTRPTAETENYWSIQRRLDELLAANKLTDSKLKSEQMNVQVAGTRFAQIIDPAEPGLRPVKPNKPLNITLGVFSGILLAGVIGGVAAFITSRIRNSRQTAKAAA